MQRVFDNLLENSLKYAGVCPVVINIAVHETEKYLILEWKDNGAGVPEEKIQKIFERFYRCDEARNEKGSGYETTLISDGTKVVEELKTNQYELLLLDIMLPGCNGYDICRAVRDEIDIPILMVTARAEAVDVIRGLGLGADDYITKPFDPLQLVARVRAHLNRYNRLTEKKGESKEKDDRITVGDLIIEAKTWKVWKKGEEIKMPRREFELLLFFAQNPNIVFSKEVLFEKIWGFDYVSDAATVSVHINRIREKIEDDARDPKIIETVWGAGYRLND